MGLLVILLVVVVVVAAVVVVVVVVAVTRKYVSAYTRRELVDGRHVLDTYKYVCT